MSKLTPEKLTAFCAALAETGIVGRACKAVGISRESAYNWREENTDFAARWDKALKIGVTALEDEAHRRAFEGCNEPLVHQGQFTPLFTDALDENGDPIMEEIAEGVRRPVRVPLLDDEGKQQYATMKKYSDTLAIFLLKAHAPEKYRENSHLQLTGPDNGPVQVEHKADRIAELMALAAKRKSKQDEDLDGLV